MEVMWVALAAVVAVVLSVVVYRAIDKVRRRYPSRATDSTDKQAPPAATATYLTVAVILLGITVYGFSKGTDMVGGNYRRMPGWTFGCVGMVGLIGIGHILWKRRRGETIKLRE